MPCMVRVRIMILVMHSVNAFVIFVLNLWSWYCCCLSWWHHRQVVDSGLSPSGVPHRYWWAWTPLGTPKVALFVALKSIAAQGNHVYLNFFLRKVTRFGTTDRNAFRGWSPMGSCTICLTISAAAHCWCCRRGSRMSSPMPAHVLPQVQPYFMCSWLSSLHGALNHVLCAMAVCPSCASHSWSRLVQVILLGYEWMVLEIINNCVKSFVLLSLGCCMHRAAIIIV
jgi:hypothetical protein